MHTGFVVYKSRGITTLSSMHPQQQYQQQESLVPALLRKTKEKTNVESKADERGMYVLHIYVMSLKTKSRWKQLHQNCKIISYS